MAKVKDILRHVTTEVAGARRKCHRHPKERPILKGEVCVVIKEGAQAKHSYCVICASEIFEHAKRRLDELTKRATR